MWLIKDSARRKEANLSDPCRNIFIIVTAVGGFLPQFLLNDIEALKSSDCDVYYASNFDFPFYELDMEALRQKGIHLYPIPITTSPVHLIAHMRTIGRLRRLIDQTGACVLHCHNPMGGADARIAAWLSKKRPYVIYTTHGFHFYKGGPLFSNWIFKTAESILARVTDRIIAINREDAKAAARMPVRRKVKKGSQYYGNVNRIPGVGVDEKRFCPNPALSMEARKSLGIPKNAFHIVTAGEVNANKNQAVVIDAIAAIKEKEGIRDIYFTICGSGDMEDALREKIRSLRLEAHIHLIGHRTDMERILQSADVFAFPSIREGFGIAPVEALLCGVPIIVGDNRGTREYAIEGRNAIVCRKNSSEEWQQAILRLYQSPDERKKLADHARVSAWRFRNHATECCMQKIYKEVLCEIKEQKRR